MTAITLDNFRNRIRRLAGWVGSGVITNTLLDETINARVGEFCDLLDDQFEGYRDTKTTLVTVSGNELVSLPTGFLKARALAILVDGKYVPLDRYAISQTYAHGTATGEPEGYMVVGDSLELFPTPDAVYTLLLRYIPEADVLVEDEDSIDIPNGWEAWIINGVAADIAGPREERDVSSYLAQCDRIKARVAASAKTRDTGGPRYVPIPGEGGGRSRL